MLPRLARLEAAGSAPEAGRGEAGAALGPPPGANRCCAPSRAANFSLAALPAPAASFFPILSSSSPLP